jgi:hypothetical protein
MILFGAMFTILLPVPSHANLTIRVQSSTPLYDDPPAFELSVIVENRGGIPLVVLPQALRRVYSAVGSGSAEYTPYPGPPVPPWKGAFSLQPGQTRTLTFVGMRDGDGSWKIEPGRYELRVILSVSGDTAKSAEEHVAHLGAAIWQGNLQSSAILITYTPLRRLNKALEVTGQRASAPASRACVVCQPVYPQVWPAAERPVRYLLNEYGHPERVL